MYARARGRRWIRKTRAQIHKRGLIAEAIGWLFCERLGLPIPDIAIYLPGEYTQDCWLSEQIRLVEHWSPTRTPVQNLGDMGGILAVDAVLGNADRHEGNILLQPQVIEGEESWKLWAIDFEISAVGDGERFRELGSRVPEVSSLPQSLPFESLYKPALEVAQEIASFEEQFITSTVEAAWTLFDGSDGELLQSLLYQRCEEAVSLIDTYFKAIMESL